MRSCFLYAARRGCCGSRYSNCAHLLARLQQLAGQAGGDSFSILLQVLAIAFVAQLAADLCREAGLAAAAFCMEFVGRILAMLQALPLLQSLLASFLSFLS